MDKYQQQPRQRRFDPLSWWTRRLPHPAWKVEKIPGGTRHSRPGESMYDTDLPWVVYHYGRTVDPWWPIWRSVRVLGRAAVECECAVCGHSRVVVAPIPRFGPVNPEGREHPERTRFKLDHLHRERPHQMAWAKPLLNLAATGVIDLDLLAMRLEADLRADAGAAGRPQ